MNGLSSTTIAESSVPAVTPVSGEVPEGLPAVSGASPVGDLPVAGELSLERLEARICSQAAHIAASTCGWLLLVAEFERRKGWAQWGLKSCAHWLSWACSVSAQSAREYLRVARSLEGLPLIVAAFAAGRLSYSKVKVLTRVAGAVPEQTLLEQALLHTASQLQRVVREFGKTDSAGVDQQRQRKARWFWDEDGMFVLTARLPADEGAILLAALRAAEQSLGVPPGQDAAPGGGAADRPASGDGDVGGVDVDGARPDVEGAVRGASGRISSRPEDCLSAEALVRRDSEQGGWCTADALMAMAQNALAAGPVDGSGDDRHLLVLHVDAAMLAEPLGPVGSGGAGGQDGLGRRHLEDGPGVARSTAERLICDAAVVAVVRSGLGPLLRGEPLRVGRRTRKISAGLRRALRVRDGGCQFPGCHRRRHLEAHHVMHWRSGGGTDLDNLVLVCRFHHMQVHEGGFTVGFAGPTSAGATSSGWVFHRPDGVAVPGVRILLPGPHPGMDTGDDTGDDIGIDIDDFNVVDEEAAQSRLGGGFSLADSVGVFCRAADGPAGALGFAGDDAFNAFDLYDSFESATNPPVTESAAAPTESAAERPSVCRPVTAGEDLINNTDFNRFDTFDEIMAFCRTALFAPQGAR